MNPLKFLYDTLIHDDFEWSGSIQRQTILPIDSFPAIVIEEQPFDYNQFIQSDVVTDATERFIIFVIVETGSTSEITDAQYYAFRNTCKGYADDVVSEIITKSIPQNDLANVKFGEATPNHMLIGDTNTFLYEIPITIHYLKTIT